MSLPESDAPAPDRQQPRIGPQQPLAAARPVGTSAAEHLSPAFPERAARGTADKLRAWQEEALAAYLSGDRRDFLAAATPGAGKTTFALRVATELIARREVERVTVVAPTEHLKRQWADAAHRVGLRLNPGFANGDAWGGRRFHGVAVTYAQVAARAEFHRRVTESAPTLVILDEVHHGGDALSWGDAVREAFGPAQRRLSLTGTPFRSDTAPIPFVEYEPGPDGVRISRTDYRYGYGRALADGVVRPVIFLTYAGRMRWRTRMGDELEARLGQPDTKDVTAQAWRTALDPGGDWIRSVLAAADRRLTEVRTDVPDAGGLVVATDQRSARAYAALLHGITGREPALVVSDDPASTSRIERFARSDERWMVAVRMVSEGVDVPRLSVGVYATNASTPLYFAQAVGRFVRARRRGETATIFLPTVPVLLGHASALEVERDHALDRESADDQLLDDSLLESAQRDQPAADRLLEAYEWLPLESAAEFDHALYDGHAFGTTAQPGSPEEQDFIGIPGILEPGQVRELLRQRQARQARRARLATAAHPPDHPQSEPQALFRTLGEQRRLLHALVGMRARASGQPHAHIHAELRRICGGPEVSRATVNQLQARIDHLRGGN